MLSPLLPAASVFPCVDELVDVGEGPRKEDTRSKSGGSGMVKWIACNTIMIMTERDREPRARQAEAGAPRRLSVRGG